METKRVFSKENPFTLDTTPSDVADYFNAIASQYGSVRAFCTLNNLPNSFYYRMNRASSCIITITTLHTLNESLKYYHKDVQIKESIKGAALELLGVIKKKYVSVYHFCESNDMMSDYQRIVGYTSGRRKKLSRELIKKINKILEKNEK